MSARSDAAVSAGIVEGDPGAVRTLPATIRERIALTRVACIAGMIYTHVPDSVIAGAAASAPWPVLLENLLVEGPGRASAALLSLVSGLLTAVALTRTAPARLYRRRARTILVPMVLWSTLTFLLYALLSLVRPTFLQLPPGSGAFDTVMHYLNTVLFLTDMTYGPTLHLGFLRDLFVCILLAPVLLALLRRVGALLLLVLGALYLFDVESVIVLRPLVVFAFAVGLWLIERDARLDALDGAWPLWVVLAVVAAMLVMLSGGGAWQGSEPARWFAERGLDLRETLLYPLSRLFGGLAIWTLTARYAGTRWSRRLDRASPYVFVAFCSHYLVLTLINEGVIGPLIGPGGSAAFALWFVVAPLVAILCAAVLVESLGRVFPALAALLTGGRVGRQVVQRREGAPSDG